MRPDKNKDKSEGKNADKNAAKNVDVEKALYEAFAAPVPLHKEAFLRTVPGAQIGYARFLLSQIGYIKKGTWFVSAVIFAAALCCASAVDKDRLWFLSAMMPFAALTFTTENAKSAVYEMEEMEMAARFSLRSVMLARMGILGFFHMILLCLIVLFAGRGSDYPFIRMGIYLTVPYLLTTTLGLALVRRIHGKESLYACLGTAVLVSMLHIILSGKIRILYQEALFSWWAAAFIVLFVMLMAECHKTIRRMEEPVWNLQ
ncbi:MAG: hypothetical protein NC434_05910 [Ruminococcus sp.]|nr:hypothetical protein [Ruminococcus sp.]